MTEDWAAGTGWRLPGQGTVRSQPCWAETQVRRSHYACFRANVLIHATFDAASEASHEFTVCPAVFIRIPVVSGNSYPGLAGYVIHSQRLHT